jgi:hypothetical protein
LAALGIGNPFPIPREAWGLASLLSRGVYVYDHDPSEYFKEKVERQRDENVSLLQTTTLTMTTIQ